MPVGGWQYKKQAKEHENTNPSDYAHFDNESPFSGAVRILDTAIGSNYATGKPTDAADDAGDYTWMHDFPLLSRRMRN